MKYIKAYESIKGTYENINLKYHEGDYVYINGNDEFEPYCKIILVNSKSTKRSWDYMINLFFIKENRFMNTYAGTGSSSTVNTEKHIISRKLTQDEINDFEAKKQAIKYNL
jgi:hypothetical protein